MPKVTFSQGKMPKYKTVRGKDVPVGHAFCACDEDPSELNNIRIRCSGGYIMFRNLHVSRLSDYMLAFSCIDLGPIEGLTVRGPTYE
jgi:hypothetical protein